MFTESYTIIYAHIHGFGHCLFYKKIRVYVYTLHLAFPTQQKIMKIPEVKGIWEHLVLWHFTDAACFTIEGKTLY